MLVVCHNYSYSIFYNFITFRVNSILKMFASTTASNMKTCGETKVWVLNPNLASKISYERILNNFQNEAVNRSGVFVVATIS